MIIRKHLHSCISIEKNGKTLLIDPGVFCFIEGKQNPSDLPKADAVLYTHKHPDHFSLDVLKEILTENPEAQIITNASIGAELEKAGINYALTKYGEEMQVAGFTVKPIEAPHESIPVEPPENTAYLMGDVLLHPGDSLSSNLFNLKPKLLFLPVAGPWLTLNQSLALAAKIKPLIAIPIHDAIIKDFMLQRIYEISANYLMNCKVAFKPLALGEQLEL